MKIKKILLLIIIFSLSLMYGEENKSREEIVKKLFNTIEEWFGTPYLYAGLTKNGVDCSGFAKVIYKEVFNIDLPNGVSNQKILGKPVEIEDLQPGDLLFFNTTGDISHVGIYLFDKKFAHAASAGPNIGVIKSSLTEKYYKERFVFAKRIIDLSQYKENENNNIENILIEEKREEKDYSNIDIKIGKVLYREKIYEESLIFKENRKIFIQTIPYDENFNLFVENSDDNNKRRKIDNNFLILEKGNYTIKLFDKKDKIVKEIKIVVE